MVKLWTDRFKPHKNFIEAMKEVPNNNGVGYGVCVVAKSGHNNISRIPKGIGKAKTP